MANGNLGLYLRNKYGETWQKELKEGLEYLKQDFYGDKNKFSKKIRLFIDEKLKAFEEKANKGEWVEANQEACLAYLTSWATFSGAKSPIKRAEELKEEAYKLGRKVVEEVKKKVAVQDEEKIVKAVATDSLADFMWGIADGPLSVNSSLLTVLDTPEYIQRCVEEVVKYLEEIAAQ